MSNLYAAIRFSRMMVTAIDRHMAQVFEPSGMDFEVFDHFYHLKELVEGDMADMLEDLREWDE